MSSIKVIYINHMGNECTPVNAARISFGNHNKTELDEKDKKLVRYLAKHQHMSPFEHCQLSVLIKCPLYIRSQIHRHRTFSYNEISRRYTEKNLEFFLPDVIRVQSKDNRQASSGTLEDELSKGTLEDMKEFHAKSLELYEKFLKIGVPKEQARGILVQNLMTEFYMTGNLRNWVHFVQLRQHEGAQAEVQKIAVEVSRIITEKFGYAGQVLLEEK